MALDGAFLASIKNEIIARALGARVEKIHQPAKDELVIVLRTRGKNIDGVITSGTSEKLLISANSSAPRIHFTKLSIENPKTPPMLCMLLRKNIGSGKLVGVRQLGMDRTLFLDFEAINELGDLVIVTICVEIMGKHSNIIAVNNNGKIIDAVKRVSEDTSSVRPILPGMTYVIPPTQGKIDIQNHTNEELILAFKAVPNEDISKSIMQAYEGFSPMLAREITHAVTGGMPFTKSQLIQVHYDRLSDCLSFIRSNITSESADVYISYEGKTPKDFTVIPIKQFGEFYEIKKTTGPSLALDIFYSTRDIEQRMKQRSNDLLKVIINRIERVTKKLAVWEEEIQLSTKRDTLRIYGDLLNSNLHTLEKGMTSVTLDNYYDENYQKVTIPLDEMLTPVQNAQRYYNEYRKAVTAEQKLTSLLKGARDEIVYLDSIWDAITRTTSEAELNDIRLELADEGIIRAPRSSNGKVKATKPQPPLRYISSDGFTILCGRNNKQNDKLTLKDAKNYDLWLHTQRQAGSHVIVISDNKDIPDRTINEAAVIAAYNSKSRNSAQVAVDYTIVKNVKKPNGAKPGMVIFDNYKTAYVTPDENMVQKLQKN